MQIKPFSWTNDPTVLLWREWPMTSCIPCILRVCKSHWDGTSTPTHAPQGNYPSSPSALHSAVTAAFCVTCQRVVLCYSLQLWRGWAELRLTNRKQAVSKLKMYIAKHGEIGPVYINKMVINASGNHLPQQTMIESEGVGPWVLETTKETLCTQRFLCAEYQWRTAMHNQRLKASFHSLTFLPTGAQTAEPARWER